MSQNAEADQSRAQRLACPAVDELIHHSRQRTVIKISFGGKKRHNGIAGDLQIRDRFHHQRFAQRGENSLQEDLVVIRLDTPSPGSHFVYHPIHGLRRNTAPEPNECRVLLVGSTRLEGVARESREELGPARGLLNNRGPRRDNELADIRVKKPELMGYIRGED